jgi:proline dehydrogenase
VRNAVKRFLPGEQLEDAVHAAQALQEKKLAALLTNLGENVNDFEEADRTAQHYVHVAETIASSDLDAEISLKLTQIGLDLSIEHTYENFRSIAREAQKHDNFIWIDMEASTYLDVTLDFYRQARNEFPKVGVCVQSYLYRTEEDLSQLLKETSAIRLVKGAYNESKDLAFPNKKDVDENFYKLAEILLQKSKENGARAAFGTHDTQLISRIQQAAEKLNIPVESLEFQLLYGIMPNEQVRLAQQGHDVRVLISYGDFWFPWYMRRLAERPANILFVLKNIFAR